MTLDLPTLRTADLDGPVAYREWTGPDETTFVLVHGLGGSHVNWAQVAPGLAGLGRTLALDLPGFGSSPRLGRGSGLMDQRRTLARVSENLRAGPKKDAADDGRLLIAAGHQGKGAVYECRRLDSLGDGDALKKSLGASGEYNGRPSFEFGSAGEGEGTGEEQEEHVFVAPIVGEVEPLFVGGEKLDVRCLLAHAGLGCHSMRE